MNILVLVEDLRINKTSAGIVSSNVLGCLVKAGHSVTCIYDYLDDKNIEWLNKSNISFLEIIRGKKFNFFYKILKLIPKINGVFAYSIGYNFNELSKIKNWKKSIKSHLKMNNNYDFIVVLGAGNSNMNYFAVAQLDIKIPLLVNYHDPYPEFQYPEPYKGKYSLVGKLRSKMSNKVMTKAKIVSFPSQRLFEWMLQFHPILKNKSIILPHTEAHLDNLPSLPQDNIVFLDEKKFNILHTGSLLGPRNPKYLLKAFQIFINSDPEKKALAKLSVIGSISDKNELSNTNINTNTDNSVIIIKERISYKKSKEMLQSADVLLIIEAVAKESPFMPGKLTDYISANKTIMALTPQNSEVSRLLGQNYPYKTETDNIEKIVEILDKLWFNWKNKTLNIIENPLNNYISVSYWNQQFEKAVKDV